MIEKFKGKYPNIALEWQRTKPRCQNFDFGTLKFLSFCLNSSAGPQVRRSADPQLRRYAAPHFHVGSQLRNSEVRRQLTASSKSSVFHASGTHSEDKLTPTHTWWRASFYFLTPPCTSTSTDGFLLLSLSCVLCFWHVKGSCIQLINKLWMESL